MVCVFLRGYDALCSSRSVDLRLLDLDLLEDLALWSIDFRFLFDYWILTFLENLLHGL